MTRAKKISIGALITIVISSGVAYFVHARNRGIISVQTSRVLRAPQSARLRAPPKRATSRSSSAPPIPFRHRGPQDLARPEPTIFAFRNREFGESRRADSRDWARRVSDLTDEADRGENQGRMYDGTQAPRAIAGETAP